MTKLEAWHVLRDNETGRRFCHYYDKDESAIDFGEPDPMEGKEEVPYEEWSAVEISNILSSIFEYRDLGELMVSLPEITLQAMQDCQVEESKKAEIMREIMNTMMA